MSWFSHKIQNKNYIIFLEKSSITYDSPLHVSGHLSHYEGAFVSTMAGE